MLNTYNTQTQAQNHDYRRFIGYELTITTESRAAMARISAHETTEGQADSTLDFMASITSKPLRELLLGPAVCSPLNEDVSSRSTDASQPCFQPLSPYFVSLIRLVNWRFFIYLILFYFYRDLELWKKRTNFYLTLINKDKKSWRLYITLKLKEWTVTVTYKVKNEVSLYICTSHFCEYSGVFEKTKLTLLLKLGKFIILREEIKKKCESYL